MIGIRRRSGSLSLWHPIERNAMIEVTLGENDRLDWALKQFRRKLIRSGLFKDMKKRRFYEKPSEAKKRKTAD